ncbi:hypothetical protein J6590_106526, partial [Homalodisca vitripennis]
MKKCWRNVMEEAKFHERNSNAFDKRYFPSHVRKALQKLESNLQKDIIAGFDKAGIFPLSSVARNFVRGGSENLGPKPGDPGDVLCVICQ